MSARSKTRAFAGANGSRPSVSSLARPIARVADAVKTAAAHILTNRYGPALQPGPRRYTRSWIRDGATMSAALLRMGCRDEVRDFIRWYVPEQAADGNVPCCVDERGADWLVEHDSHGQLIFTVMEHYRFTHDRALLEETWPAVAKAAGYIETLRASRCTPEYASEEKRAFHGLLPESVSHEGYLAQPVHSYWDDFWALRGLGDAAEIATALGKGEEARRLRGARAPSSRDSLYASIDTVIARKRLAYVPGSVEWADFDPTATAVALGITDAAERLSPGPLHAMFEEYLKGLRARRDGTLDWASYTAYELRIVGALVRLGRRSEANELLEFFLADRRPRALESVARDLVAESAERSPPRRPSALVDRRGVRALGALDARLRARCRSCAGGRRGSPRRVARRGEAGTSARAADLLRCARLHAGARVGRHATISRSRAPSRRPAASSFVRRSRDLSPR